MSDVLLRVESLRKYFYRKSSWARGESSTAFQHLRRNLFRKTLSVRAVDGVSFDLSPGEILGLVGESGCGKSTLGRTILRLETPTDGSIYFDGQNITNLNQSQLRPLRQNIQIIFQDPYASLNPRKRIGDTIAEGLMIFALVHSAEEKRHRVAELLRKVGLPHNSANRYPHEFSGGQRQRVGIARALAVQPKLIICDEPISALDVSIQAQIVNLLRDLQKSENLTYLFISHDLNIVRHLCDRVAVMYLGKIVELTTTAQLYQRPEHPYSKALLSALPIADPQMKRTRTILTGDVPSPINPPAGCPFHPRCPEANKPAACFKQVPVLRQTAPGCFSACHLNSPAALPSAPC